MRNYVPPLIILVADKAASILLYDFGLSPNTDTIIFKGIKGVIL